MSYNFISMPGFLSNLLQSLHGRRRDMRFLCHRLLSERGEASQTAIAQEIIAAYNSMKPDQRPEFFEILSREFSPDEADVRRAAAAYEGAPSTTVTNLKSPRLAVPVRLNPAW